jgi:hypothetical protein
LAALLLCAVAFAQGLTEHQQDKLRRALAKDDRRELVALCDAIGRPARNWLNRHNAKTARWVQVYGTCRAIADRLDAMGMPGWRDARFVRLATPRSGMAGRPLPAAFRFVHGWLLDEKPRSVVLLGSGLGPVEFALKAEPGVVDVDFKQFCLDFLAAGDQPQAYNRDYYLRGGVPPPGDAWMWAYFALRSGHDKVAVRLMEHGNRVRPQRPIPFNATGMLDRHLWRRAVAAAHAGVPRPELVRLFKLANPKANQVMQYESLIVEDAKFSEPLPPDLERADTATQARYWLYKLRDHAAYAWARPKRDNTFLVKSGAARRLVDLGWDAIPIVAARLDDHRPTRSMIGPGDRLIAYRLVTHAECCRAILRALTARRLKHAREAQDWWTQMNKKGPEDYYLGLLRENYAGARRAAVHGLMRLDPRRYRDELLSTASWSGGGILDALADYLPADDPAFDKWLADDKLLVVAGTALWRKGDERGPRAILQRMKAIGPKDRDVPDIEALGRMHCKLAADGLAALLDHENVLVRRRAFLAARHLPDAVLARKLIGKLDDKTDCGGMQVRDCAAIALKDMLAYSKPITLPLPHGYHAELRRWCNVNWQTFDWDWLRRH